MFRANSIFTALLCAVACLSLAATANAQDQTRFVLKLDEKLVNDFKGYGSLRSSVPEKFTEKISFVELQFEGTKDGQPVEMNWGLQINGSTANIVLDETAIESLMAQPVRIAVPADKNTFGEIVLQYDAPTGSTPTLNDTGSPADSFFIKLEDGGTMSGDIDGFDEFEIATRFGKVSMPMDQVAGIKFHTDADDAAVVVLNNGDSITGTPTIPAIKLTTDWGQADIEPSKIDALTTTSNASFSQGNSDFGTRWNLNTGNSFAPGFRGN